MGINLNQLLNQLTENILPYEDIYYKNYISAYDKIKSLIELNSDFYYWKIATDIKVNIELSLNVIGKEFEKYEFNSFYVTYCLIKTTVFAFIIASVSSYFGYYTKGGALEVGSASTRAVVYSSIMILIFNFILTDLLLA